MIALVLAIAAPVAAKTIENIAHARWNEAGIVQEVASNRVEVTRVAAPLRLDTFRSAPGAQTKLTFMGSRCGQGRPGTPTGPGAAQILAIAPASQYRPGETIIFTLAAPFANRDSGVVDSLAITVDNSTGGHIDLTVFETGVDTGLFAGSIATRRASVGPSRAECTLVVASGDRVTLATTGGMPGGVSVTRDTLILADPFGVVFDSESAAPVSGVRVTLRDAATGALAQVFAEDGVTRWPSSVISGEPITDAAGTVYPMAPGRYWFPLAPIGRYRLQIEPPPDFAAPSAVPLAQLALLSPPDGGAFALSEGSFGDDFSLASTTWIEVDVPVDRDAKAPGLDFSVSRARAQPGDPLVYSLTVSNPEVQERRRLALEIDLPRGIRLRTETLRIDGADPPPGIVNVAPDGRSLTFALDRLPGAGAVRITYGAVIRADAVAGQLVTRAVIRDALGRNARAEATVMAEGDTIAGRMTVIGRVVLGDCGMVADTASGLVGIRVMMEDGSFAVTDADGRYRLEGVVPGTHVVQVARGSLPPGARLVDCARSTRSAGAAGSRFVTGQGGSLARADFHVVASTGGAAPFIAWADDLLSEDRLAQSVFRPALATAIAPVTSDWLALGDGPDGWLTPAEDANPRVPAIKVAFRHRAGQTIRLYVDGQPVDPVAFDGTLKAPGGGYAVSQWRGIPLLNERSVLAAEIVNSLGGVNARVERVVFFTSQPARVELVADQSLLVADGVTRPVAVVRITDRNGRPVREGLSGNYTLNAPFESAAQIEQQQLRQLSGIGEATARWQIEGDEGLARIELAPTMVSGQLRVAFDFANENIRRREEIEAWVVPGDVEWTIVGLGEASIGARTIADNMERGGNFDSDLGPNARVALYAKGRVLGKYLLTLAYDSAKQREDQPLLGAIDPAAYYTVFGDNSQRRFDAATRENLYVRIESATFFALYGDFQTGFDQTTLGRYQRTATGVRAAAQLGDLRAEAFGARIGSAFRRDEFQGNGLAGPYALGSRDILANSERVTIEVRDRFRSEVVVSARSLTRFIDYTIDVLSGTITFSEPILSRDGDLNPQIIIIEYETAQPSGGAINAGVRAEWSADDGAVRIGATALTDQGDGARTNLAVADTRLRLGEASEVRAEIGISAGAGDTATAWLVELQHQTGQLDVVAYARSVEDGYGTGQQSLAEVGRRKLGVDSRYQISDNLLAIASLLQDDSLSDAVQRRGGQVELAWRTPGTDARVGLAHFADRLASGERRSSTLLQTAASQRLFDNRLEVSGDTSIALGGGAGSLDLPPRHRLGLRYALARDVRLTGTYEIADSAAIKARTLRAGVEVSPWEGGRIISSFGQNSGGAGAGGGGAFAGIGLAQTVNVSSTLSLAATLDGNRILGDAPAPEAVINPGQPPANGGPLGVDRTLFEDFTAVTLSGAWRSGRWSANGRAEYRDGQFADRYGASLGVLRQIGEGRALGGNLVWTRSTAMGGASAEIMDAALTIAHRPDGSDFALLGRVEYRSDAVTGAVAGQTGPVGRTALSVTGDAVSRRLVGSVSANWSPRTRGGAGQLSEIGVFLGTRYGFNRVEGLDLAGLTALAGLDLRIGLSSAIDIGGSASIRASVTDGSYSYAFGPQASFVVAKETILSLGYNIAGFRDPDFSLDRPLDQGLFAGIRFKFDADTLGLAGSDSPRGGPEEALRENTE
ncbi:carboxypeptidase-like regulatory domain-containing protein [Porphyrobacter sp. ULC335]|uniref:carboxypeptidase-like regulatory domain-containing protein n=1 Tax=Porphyrobacter sp. ULC335 TaxID=2854260 RepID=UPI00221FD6BE|nr:carboxypeptidase-like regulatory domain-containing protein [Porphyrobacter sp. ULC335]UYV15418.1 carboxypeptidase-like regulatory domain-containing protein [Porphyrobacter sp. ULC335]